ncbi:MAG: hypothetical protein J3Q66DRAFT_336977 [Benniella sp.]|nr:MAG: hypothetical protein J3Q66DRAFT_336977 [Benniella sp.]
MNNHTPFAFHSQYDPSSFQQHYSQDSHAGSRKRKNSCEDVSPLVMKTRTGIGLEQEIVYDRTITMMMQGQRRLLEEERQQALVQQQQQQQQPSPLRANRESSAEAMRRLFMFNKSQSAPASTQPSFQHSLAPDDATAVSAPGRTWTFADCAGETNGCETSRVPGMQGRYQAMITPCTFCRRPQCQFCAVQCTSCQELSCRSCSAPSYEKSHVEYYCSGCRG